MTESSEQINPIKSIKKWTLKSIENQNPSWKNKLSRLFSASQNKPNIDSKIHTIQKLSPEEQVNYSKGIISLVAKNLSKPTRLLVNGQTFWFDRNGEETRDPRNAQRFEKMLEAGDIPAFTDSTSIDGVNDNIYFVQGMVINIIKETKTPLKINNTWFDGQGDIATGDNIDRFEKTFGINHSESDE